MLKEEELVQPEQSQQSGEERRGLSHPSRLPAAWRPWVLLIFCVLVLASQQTGFCPCCQWPLAEGYKCPQGAGDSAVPSLPSPG